MAFDKDEYRERRDNGVRGQGFTRKVKDVSKYPCYSADDGNHSGTPKPLSLYAVRKNTKRARKAAKRELADATV